jgi:hypothetical protein
MKRVVFAVTFCLAGASAFGVTLKELNLARDPENLEGAIYVRTVYGLNFRAGPGKHFAVLGTVPAGTEVPMVGWISGYDGGGSFWIRTWYKGRRGWLCAYAEGERLLERNGGPLFTLRANERTADDYGGKKRPAPGDELEFCYLEDEFWLTDADRDPKVEFRVKYGDDRAYLRAYRGEDVPEGRYSFDPRPPAPTAAGWTVDFEPEFLELNLTYNRERCTFYFMDPEDSVFRLGPGFEFEEEFDLWFLTTNILFVDGEWALVNAFYAWEWIYLGTEREPNVGLLREIPYVLEERCPGAEAAEAGASLVHSEKWVTIYDTYWPRANTVYVEFSEPYFSEDIGKLKLLEAAFFQPPQAEEPLCVRPAGEGKEGGYHETVMLAYSFEVPTTLDRDAPFRISTKMLYEGAEEFEVDFNCNPPR